MPYLRAAAMTRSKSGSTGCGGLEGSSIVSQASAMYVSITPPGDCTIRMRACESLDRAGALATLGEPRQAHQGAADRRPLAVHGNRDIGGSGGRLRLFAGAGSRDQPLGGTGDSSSGIKPLTQGVFWWYRPRREWSSTRVWSHPSPRSRRTHRASPWRYQIDCRLHHRPFRCSRAAGAGGGLARPDGGYPAAGVPGVRASNRR